MKLEHPNLKALPTFKLKIYTLLPYYKYDTWNNEGRVDRIMSREMGHGGERVIDTIVVV